MVTALQRSIDLTIQILIRLVAIVLFTPVFGIPGLLVSVAGGWVGQMYMKAQLSATREMSNAKAPVIGHLSAAFAGLGERAFYLANQILGIEVVISVYQGIRSSARFQTRIV